MSATATLATPGEVRGLLEAMATPSPSLHPDVHSDDSWKRWNGWNKTLLVGIDAEGTPFEAHLSHYASGWSDLTAGAVGSIPHGSLTDEEFATRTGLVFPVQVLPPKSVILHPEHTP